MAESRYELLTKYADEGFVPPDDWTTSLIVRSEAIRHRKIAYMAAVAAEVPRRLGEEASSIEMAGDKFLSKGIANSYWTLWRRLVVGRNAPLPAEELSDDEVTLYPPETWATLHARGAASDDARRAGRTVLWVPWWSDLRPRLLGRRRAIATFAVRNDSLGWGYRVVSGIGSEIEWVERKFGDWEERYMSHAA